MRAKSFRSHAYFFLAEDKKSNQIGEGKKGMGGRVVKKAYLTVEIMRSANRKKRL